MTSLTPPRFIELQEMWCDYTYVYATFLTYSESVVFVCFIFLLDIGPVLIVLYLFVSFFY